MEDSYLGHNKAWDSRIPPAAAIDCIGYSQQVRRYIDIIQRLASNDHASAWYYDQLIGYLAGPSGLPQSVQDFDFTRNARDKVDRDTDHNSESGLDVSIEQDNVAAHPRIAVIEGFPSRNNIAELGVALNIDPRFFLENLDFSQRGPSSRDATCYALPALPWASRNAIHFRFVSLGSMPTAPFRGSPTEYQNRLRDACQINQARLFESHRNGISRWRQVQIHGLHHWSLEQVLSFTVSKTGRDWTALIISDHGLSAPGCADGLPWTVRSQEKQPQGTIPLVTLPTGVSDPSGTRSGSPSDPDLAKSRTLRGLRFHDDTDYKLFQGDPFFLYHAVLRTMLESWSQLINFLETDVERLRRTSSETFTDTLEQLRLTSSMLYRGRQFVLGHVPIVKRGGCDGWPVATSKEPGERKAALQAEMLMVIEALTERYTSLLQECSSLSQLLVSTAQVIESQRAIRQSHEVNALTQLAFTFIPGGFVAGLFSMSVKEFTDDPPSIWLFFAIAVPIMTLFGIFTAQPVRKKARTAWRISRKFAMERMPGLKMKAEDWKTV